MTTRPIPVALSLVLAAFAGGPGPAQGGAPAHTGASLQPIRAFPGSGGPGALVTLRGAGIGSAGSVHLGGHRAAFVRVSADTLLVRVPADARSADWRVGVDGEAREGPEFNVAPATRAARWRSLPGLARPHHRGASAVLPGDLLFIAGGLVDQDGETITDRAELYDVRAGRTAWTGRLPLPLMGSTCTVLADGRVLVAGGTSTAALDDPSEAAYLFDPRSKGFTRVGPLVQPRREHAALLLPSGEVLLVGGTGDHWRSGFSDRSARLVTELFNPESATFRPGPELGGARRHPALLLLPDGRVLVAGGRTDGAGLHSTEFLDIQAGTRRDGPRLEVVGCPLALSLQPDGRVLAAGASRILLEREGVVPTVQGLGTFQLLDPASGTTAPCTFAKNQTWWLGSGLALPDGGLLLAANEPRPGDLRFDRFDPASGGFQRGPGLRHAVGFERLHLLEDGRVVALGGLEIRPFTRPSSRVFILE